MTTIFVHDVRWYREQVTAGIDPERGQWVVEILVNDLRPPIYLKFPSGPRPYWDTQVLPALEHALTEVRLV
jgi:hypothetical protein